MAGYWLHCVINMGDNGGGMAFVVDKIRAFALNRTKALKDFLGAPTPIITVHITFTAGIMPKFSQSTNPSESGAAVESGDEEDSKSLGVRATVEITAALLAVIYYVWKLAPILFSML